VDRVFAPGASKAHAPDTYDRQQRKGTHEEKRMNRGK
jgi:hypothetical protein